MLDQILLMCMFNMFIDRRNLSYVWDINSDFDEQPIKMYFF